MGAVDFERAVLGAVLLDPNHWRQTAVLCPADFALDAHRRIFACMRDLAEFPRPIDIVTLCDELGRRKELDAIRGEEYIAGLLDGVPDRPSIDHYVRMIRVCADRRRAAKLTEKAYRLAEDPSVSTSALAEIGNDLAELSDRIESLPPQFSEEALALRFTRKYEGELRYVAGWGRWMYWDGVRWREDDTLAVFDRCRAICRHASAECGDAKERVAMKIAGAQTVAAIERLARADRRHAALVEQWDADPWLLNTPAGTIDLRTGEMFRHRRDDNITRITAAGPGGDCPLWLLFLERVTGGDSELRSFLQRMVGYALTGSTREHALFFLYGTGANGKSVFLSVVSELLADYAKTAPVSSFTASANEQHPTDLAGLRSARLVTATETEDGARWAESKIKVLTGGDRISARFMRCDFFEFTPKFKLVIAGNHKPSLRSVDEAIRRRLHLVPFTVTIPKEERDPSLAEKLRAEFPGILSWAIQGCLAWQEEGLNSPAAVREATTDYLDSEDAIGRWLEDRCVIDEKRWTAAGTLFANWQAWCDDTGEREGSQKHFAQQLEARGFQRHRTNRAKGFTGIGLREDVVPDVPGFPIFPVSRARAVTLYMEQSGTTGTEKERAR
jgi:putative DNA primase/helicase